MAVLVMGGAGSIRSRMVRAPLDTDRGEIVALDGRASGFDRAPAWMGKPDPRNRV